MRVSGAIHITGDVEGEKVFITYNKSATKPNKPSGTGETDGWSAANEDGAIWMSVKNATDINEGEWSEPIRVKGEQGERGYQGPIPYLAGAWDSTKSYTRTITKVPIVVDEGEHYYLRNDGTVTGGDAPHIGYAANPNTSTWVLIEGMQWLFVEILLAQWAKLGSAIFDNNKLISQYGILNGAESTQYQEPGFDPNIELDFLNGKSKFNDVIIKGSSRSKFTYCPDSSKIDYSDNVAMISNNDGWIDVYYLPWDISQSGRQITIVNYKWGSNISQGSEFIFAPSGKYFFEHGVNKDRIVVGSQAVQLLGYGDDSTFYGWIVLGRTDIKSTSLYGGVGKPVKFFAIGNVYGSGTDADIDYQTYDGSTMSVSRLDVGKYKITFNSSWFSMPNMAFVIVSGIGYALNTTNPIKATVTIRQPSYITVETSDDESRNDGSFSFLITDLYTFDKWQ